MLTLFEHFPGHGILGTMAKHQASLIYSRGRQVGGHKVFQAVASFANLDQLMQMRMIWKVQSALCRFSFKKTWKGIEFS